MVWVPPASEPCVRISRTRFSGRWFTFVRTGRDMGRCQTKQPLHGEADVVPAMKVPPLGVTPTFAAFPQNGAQPLADEAVHPAEHVPMAVLEVLEPSRAVCG